MHVCTVGILCKLHTLVCPLSFASISTSFVLIIGLYIVYQIHISSWGKLEQLIIAFYPHKHLNYQTSKGQENNKSTVYVQCTTHLTFINSGATDREINCPCLLFSLLIFQFIKKSNSPASYSRVYQNRGFPQKCLKTLGPVKFLNNYVHWSL